MAFIDAFKRRLQQVPGYAGNNLQSQLDDEQWHPPMAAPEGAPQAAELPAARQVQWIRPTPTAMPETQSQAPETRIDVQDAPPPVPVVRNSQTGEPNKQVINSLNPENGPSEYYGDLQKWEPRGGKRGLKNALKTGAMYAAEAVQRNPDHPVEAAIAGFGTGAIGGTAQPNFSSRLTRQWKLGQAGQDLERDLNLKKQQAQIENLGDVPVRLANGDIVMTPRPKAGTLASQQQSVETRNAAERRQAEMAAAHQQRWKDLTGLARRRQIAKDYKDGLLNDSPTALADAAEELGIDEGLKPAFIRGEMRDAVNERGELVNVNRRTNQAAPVVGADGKPVVGFVQTQEKNRDERARKQRENSRGNAIIMANRQVGSMGDPEEFDRLANDAEEDAKDAEAQAKSLQNTGLASDKTTARQYLSEAARYRRQVRELKTKASQARGGRGAVGGGAQPSTPVAPTGKFDRNKYIKTFQRLHKGAQPSQEQIEQAETMWTNP